MGLGLHSRFSNWDCLHHSFLKGRYYSHINPVQVAPVIISVSKDGEGNTHPRVDSSNMKYTSSSSSSSSSSQLEIESLMHHNAGLVSFGTPVMRLPAWWAPEYWTNGRNVRHQEMHWKCRPPQVAMQMYAFFNSIQLKHTNIMFKKFPKSMKAEPSWRFEKKQKNINESKNNNNCYQFSGVRHPKKPSRSLQGKRETKIRVPGSLHRLWRLGGEIAIQVDGV